MTQMKDFRVGSRSVGALEKEGVGAFNEVAPRIPEQSTVVCVLELVEQNEKRVLATAGAPADFSRLNSVHFCDTEARVESELILEVSEN